MPVGNHLNFTNHQAYHHNLSQRSMIILRDVTEKNRVVNGRGLDRSMEDTSKSLKKHYQFSRAVKRSGDKHDEDDDENEDEEDEGCDVQAWETLSKSFNDVQSVLDHNRVLIKQVNENHQSKVADNLVKNVALIQEINGNISKVMGIYSDLSVNFSSIVQQRQALSKSSGDTSNSCSNS